MIETLYRTTTPNSLVVHEHYFELAMGEQAVDGQAGYFVRETHCWWDPARKSTARVQYTLSPRTGFATREEAQERYHLQRQFRAQRGFVHSFSPRFESSRRHRYERIVIAPVECEALANS